MNMHSTPKVPDNAGLENAICRVTYAARLVRLALDGEHDSTGENALHVAVEFMEREAEAASDIYQAMMRARRSA